MTWAMLRRVPTLSTATSILSLQAAHSQMLRRPIRIGWMNTSSSSSNGTNLQALAIGLSEFGWKQGVDFFIEERWVEGKYELLNAIALDLASHHPDVIVTAPLQATIAVAKAAPHTAIVQADGGDLLAVGLAETLGHPGGSVTGLTNIAGDTVDKYLEFLLATVTPRRIGFLADTGNRNLPVLMTTIRSSISATQIDSVFEYVSQSDEITPALERLHDLQVDSLVILSSAMSRLHAKEIGNMALRYRWPVVTGDRAIVEAGALIGYAHNPNHNFDRAASFIERIANGLNPAELPIEQPTKIDLILNKKAATLLGIPIPQEIFVLADEVIE